ncbi:MAG: hypothetical protein PHD32_10365 [Eubacteriales bacterium]|nr:hypothetical protein [Eubacteriales bacterium]
MSDSESLQSICRALVRAAQQSTALAADHAQGRAQLLETARRCTHAAKALERLGKT